MDNGIAYSEQPERMQELAASSSAEAIQQFVTKWLAILPHPFTPDDHADGYSYHISILPAEFPLTYVFERPLAADSSSRR